MLAANPDLEIAPGASAELHRHLDELADATLVQNLERILGQKSMLDVERQEASRIVPR